MSEPVRKVTIGIELNVITAQITDDWDELTAIRQQFADIGDRLMQAGPGNRAVSLTWSVDRVPGSGRAVFPYREEREHADGTDRP